MTRRHVNFTLQPDLLFVPLRVHSRSGCDHLSRNMLLFCSRLFPLLIFAALSELELSPGFNLDTQFPLIFTDNNAATKRNSYFGFSVGLHSNGHQRWLLAGAPRANSSERNSSVEPGVVYKCALNNRSCYEIPFYKTPIEKFSTESYKEFPDKGWLGVSLDVASIDQPNIIACAHLWKNKYYLKSHMMLVNGICFVSDPELDSSRMERLTALTEISKQVWGNATHYYYGLGLMGISAQFVKDSNDLIFGAPGVFDFKGTAIYSAERSYSKAQPLQKFLSPFLPDSIPFNSYFGYSVSSGNFFDKYSWQLIAGAPREGSAGVVYVYNIPDGEQSSLVVRIKKEGSQIGEYFGAAVCGVDINNDGFSDLLVGAPFHSIQIDEGKVYLYINKQQGRLVATREDLIGSSVKARFGSAITAIGDLDQDGYQDVAIGAPYEEEVGSVYIYRGHSLGLILSQRISATEINSGLRGFGMSISKGLDIDDNKYLDLAIGAYESDKAVLLRSYPVVQVKTELQFSVEKINMEHLTCSWANVPTACFNLTACISYSSTNGPSLVSFDIYLSLNQMEQRGFLINRNEKKQRIIFHSSVKQDELMCKNIIVHILNSTTNFLKPIEFSVKSELSKNHLLQTFCDDCPVRDPEDEEEIIKQVSFSIMCGPDDICESDLKVTAHFLELRESSEFVIGSSQKITLKIEVENRGEPAYETQAIISFPPNTNLWSTPRECSKINTDVVNIVLLCHIDSGKPLKTNSKAELKIPVDVSLVKPSSSNALQFTVYCNTTSRDTNEDDNIHRVLLPLKVDATINVIGRTSDDQILFRNGKNVLDDTTTTFVHEFQVFKTGETPIESVLLEIEIPSVSFDGGQSILKNISIKPTISGDLNIYDGGCYLIGTGNSGAGSQFSDPFSRNFLMKCIDYHRYKVQYKMGSFIERESANIALTLNFDPEIMRHLIEKHDIVEFVSHGRVTILDDGFPQNISQDYVEVMTQFINEGSLPETVSIWIIIVCVIVGIVLLSIIIIIMAKCGFFRRNIKEEMEKLTSNDQLLNEDESTDGITPAD